MTRRTLPAALAFGWLGAAAQSDPPASFAGILKRASGSKLLLELHDGNVMEFHTTKRTKYVVDGKPAKFKDLSEGRPAEVEGRYFLGTVEVVTIAQNGEKPQQN